MNQNDVTQVGEKVSHLCDMYEGLTTYASSPNYV